MTDEELEELKHQYDRWCKKQERIIFWLGVSLVVMLIVILIINS